MIENKVFWFDEDNNEINIKNKQDIVINMPSDQTVIIDKLYGSLDFCKIRITPVVKTCTWKIEKQVIKQDANDNDICEWETVIEFEAQDDGNDVKY